MNTKSEQPDTAIYKARIRAGISQRKLSEVIDIDREALRLWEKTGKEPKLRPSQVAALLKVLQCELSEILDYDQQAA